MAFTQSHSIICVQLVVQSKHQEFRSDCRYETREVCKSSRGYGSLSAFCGWSDGGVRDRKFVLAHLALNNIGAGKSSFPPPPGVTEAALPARERSGRAYVDPRNYGAETSGTSPNMPTQMTSQTNTIVVSVCA